MKSSLISLILFLLLLSGCSSPPEQTQYYMLNNLQNAAPSNAPQKVNVCNTYTVSIAMPEYLNQPYLAMQVHEHQMHYSNSHMWVEPLATGVQKSLLDDLNANSSHSKFTAMRSSGASNNSSTINIEVNYFHVSENSEVIFSGQFTLDEESQNTQHPFLYKSQLNNDGYNHSVAQMRQLVSKLANSILNQITNCQHK
ncbi:MAG: PqiC family protein [Colwellia sp.]|nr:PqiC family protein [Colwellia sp.]MCW8863298.1 PqiC family protein [Colwellia sp.]MCW9081281.1 PqiC family protein [Colwellia sp.]